MMTILHSRLSAFVLLAALVCAPLPSFAAPAVAGSAQVLQFAAGTQDPAGQSVTVDASATACYFLWQFYQAAAGHGLASVTLAGNAPAQSYEVASATGDQEASGVAVWYNPPTGTQTLDPAWDAAPTDPTVTFFCTSGGDTSSWRDVQAANESSSTATSVTVTTVSGDFVVKYDTHFSATTPTLTSGWTSIATEGGGTTGQTNRTSSISATTTSQVCASQEPSYSTIVCFSIPASSATPRSAIIQLLQAQ